MNGENATELVMSEKRWRGRMPFRMQRRGRPEPLEHQGRGGEPSLANFRRMLDYMRGYDESSQGRAEGSFTEGVRKAFRAWRKEHGLGWHDSISFEYRLHRHRQVLVTLAYANVYHRRLRGDGSKGFVLTGEVLSIDGLQPDRRNKRGEFALTRIVGRHPVRALVERVDATELKEE